MGWRRFHREDSILYIKLSKITQPNSGKNDIKIELWCVEHVANPVGGFDKFCRERPIDFIAQIFYVDINSVVPAVLAGFPDMVDDHLASHNLATVAGQVF